MNNLIEAIDKEASALPPEFQREVLDFIGYLHVKRERQADPRVAGAGMGSRT